MRTTRGELERLADAQGYRSEILEKVLWMLDLLQAIYADRFLAERLALKGGTALNLFILDMPRLSVDIDLNYIGSADLAVTEKERPQITDAIERLCRSLGLTPNRLPGEHAGGKWRMTYQSHITPTGNLEVDLNFLQRVPLWPTVLRDSSLVGQHQAKAVRVMDDHELVAGKLSALLSRVAARDLFDTARLATIRNLDPDKLRLAFVLYGAISRTDWRTLALADVEHDLKDVEHRLIPVLAQGSVPPAKQLDAWVGELSAAAKAFVGGVLPLRPHEIAFLDLLLDSGEIDGKHLTDDPALLALIAVSPGLLWKAKNVKQFRAKK